MIKLGEFRKKKMSFKEWLESEKKEGFFRVTTLFPPNKYQSYTLIFWDGDIEVRVSVKTEKFKEAMKALGITIGRKLPSILVIIEKDFYGIDVDNTYQLVWKNSYWKLEKEVEKEVDDIPF